MLEGAAASRIPRTASVTPTELATQAAAYGIISLDSGISRTATATPMRGTAAMKGSEMGGPAPNRAVSTSSSRTAQRIGSGRRRTLTTTANQATNGSPK